MNMSAGVATRKWYFGPKLNVKRASAAAVLCRGSIFALGGFSRGDKWLDSVEMLGAEEDALWEMYDAQLIRGRAFHSAVSLNDQLFVIGGAYEPEMMQGSVEMLNFEGSQWIEAHPMQQARRNLACVSFPFRGCIYATGGVAADGRNLSTVERYDPREGAWISVSDMARPRAHHSAVIVHDLLYAMGGFKSDGAIEVYDPRMNLWFDGPNLPFDRTGFAAVNVRSGIITTGGLCEQVLSSTAYLPLIPASLCSVKATCRAVASEISSAGFELQSASLEFQCGDRLVHTAVSNTDARKSLHQLIRDCRPVGFPAASDSQSPIPVSISKIDIDKGTMVKPSRMRVLVVGNGRVGKTSLIGNLSSGGVAFRHDQPSTEVADVSTFEISIKKHEWRPLKYGATSVLSHVIRQKLTEPFGSAETETDAALAVGPATASSSAGSGTSNSKARSRKRPRISHGKRPVAKRRPSDVNNAAASINDVPPSAHSGTSTDRPSVRRRVDSVTCSEAVAVTAETLSELDRDSLSLSVLDFAGQDVFRVFDPFFFGKQCLYFCVFSFAKLHAADLNNSLEFEVDKSILSWLRLIDSVGSTIGSSRDGESRVILIGTHCASFSSPSREDFFCRVNILLTKSCDEGRQPFRSFRVQTFDEWRFVRIENDPACRQTLMEEGSQFASQTVLCEAILDFHRALPKVLLQNLIVESVFRNHNLVVADVADSFSTLADLKSVCCSVDDLKTCLKDLVSLGSFFALSADASMFVVKPEVFIKACAQMIPNKIPDAGRGRLPLPLPLPLRMEQMLHFDCDLWERRGILFRDTADRVISDYLTPVIEDACERDLCVKRIFSMLEQLGVVIPIVSNESKHQYFYPQWHQSSASHQSGETSVKSVGELWNVQLLHTMPGAKRCSFAVRFVASDFPAGYDYDGVITDNHFWRFIHFLGNEVSFQPRISSEDPPVTTSDVIVERPRPDAKEKCRIRQIHGSNSPSSCFVFDCAIVGTSVEVDGPSWSGTNMYNLVARFVEKDPMSARLKPILGFMFDNAVFVPNTRLDDVIQRLSSVRSDLKSQIDEYQGLQGNWRTYHDTCAPKTKDKTGARDISNALDDAARLIGDVYTPFRNRFAMKLGTLIPNQDGKVLATAVVELACEKSSRTSLLAVCKHDGKSCAEVWRELLESPHLHTLRLGAFAAAVHEAASDLDFP
ncbi:mitochondrial Kelch and P-loop NTPase domain-containing protein, partial [Andalucia godoyi]|eukprot:ANDGO_08376.mRNA.1 mitochondrial Kelch and P-loop NTPase domain-containing protein